MVGTEEKAFPAKGGVSSFYVTHIPEGVTYNELWEILMVYGKVVDVYLEKKKYVSGSHFEFVRFKGVENTKEFEVRIDKVKCRNCIHNMNEAISVHKPLSRGNPSLPRRILVTDANRPTFMEGLGYVKNRNPLWKLSKAEMVISDNKLVKLLFISNSLLIRMSYLQRKLWWVKFKVLNTYITFHLHSKRMVCRE